GRADRAESILRAALRNEPAPPERAQLLYGLATTGLLTDRPDVAIAATAEALELIPAEPTVIRARLLATRVLALVAPGDRNEEAEQLLGRGGRPGPTVRAPGRLGRGPGGAGLAGSAGGGPGRGPGAAARGGRGRPGAERPGRAARAVQPGRAGARER